MASVCKTELNIAIAKFIQKHLTCSICLDEFDDPRRLICSHVYCRKCLQEHINATAGHRYVRGGSELWTGFSCPECRRLIKIPRPWQSKDTWACQMNVDFKTASIQADLREENLVLSDPSRFGQTERNEEIYSGTRDFLTQTEPPGVKSVGAVGSTCRSIHVQTEPDNARTDKVHLKAKRTQVKSKAVAGRARARQQPPEERNPQDVKKTIKATFLKENASLTKKGEYVRVISLYEEESPPELYDLVVLVQGENKIIVTFDLQKNEILTFTLDGAMRVSYKNKLGIGYKPWRICKVSKTQVAVTVSEPNAIIICSIGTEISMNQLIPTRTHYDGISSMTEGIFVVTARNDVDIINDKGRVLREYKIPEPPTEADNSYVVCTPNENIIVTDCAGNAVSCVTQSGKVAWARKMDPLGVACDVDGSIYIVDAMAEAVIVLTSRGQFVSRVLEKSEVFSRPSGIAVDNTGYMYVICDFKDITIWDLGSSQMEYE